MKFLTFLILLISVAATFIPCCEFDGCEEEIANSSNQSQKKQDASCSPLSVCPTCATAIVIAPTVELPGIIISKTEKPPIETPSRLPLYSSFFWQPPRVS
jgi:hypothetical protein